MDANVTDSKHHCFVTNITLPYPLSGVGQEEAGADPNQSSAGDESGDLKEAGGHTRVRLCQVFCLVQYLTLTHIFGILKSCL